MIPAAAYEWERLWAPYDEPTYGEILSAVLPEDVVLEIGAGDLRLSRRLAGVAREVIAWEIQGDILQRAAPNLPPNLTVWQVDARQAPVPPGVSTAVLLMRHCQHFQLYVHKLRASGCKRLITNARWGLGIEVLNLRLPRLLYNALPMGWFACWCGHTGFKVGAAEFLTRELETAVFEVIDCPNCH